MINFFEYKILNILNYIFLLVFKNFIIGFLIVIFGIVVSIWNL